MDILKMQDRTAIALALHALKTYYPSKLDSVAEFRRSSDPLVQEALA